MYTQEGLPRIIAIGASAGGLNAIQDFFDHIPDNLGVAFVVIQHLSPDYKSLMPELLSRHTNMPIQTAGEGMRAKANNVYLNDRYTNLSIRHGIFRLEPKAPKHTLNLPIDLFFTAIGSEYQEDSIGIIFSGTGSDGARGITTIKHFGGTVLVQDPDSAQFDGMPISAINTEQSDYVSTVDKIASIVIKLCTEDGENSQPDELVKFIGNNTLQSILNVLHKCSGIDFTAYKHKTLLRRIDKRMKILDIKKSIDYLGLLKNDSVECEQLSQEFLINVTEFFRDREVFDALYETVIPELFKRRTEDQGIRVWVAGCSTGQEAYSIAMHIMEYAERHNLIANFTVFATDIDELAIEKASEGKFTQANIANIPKHYISKYLLKTVDGYKFNSSLRNKIVFAKHNLLSDPPFVDIDLVSCRNVLIYLDPTWQLSLHNRFDFGLNHAGFMVLGTSDSLLGRTKDYQPISDDVKIYKKLTDNTRKKKTPIPFVSSPKKIKMDVIKRKVEDPHHPKIEKRIHAESFEKILCDMYAPSSIIVDSRYDIRYIKGEAGKKLIHKEGAFEQNLLALVSSELGTIITGGINKARSQSTPVLYKNIREQKQDITLEFDLRFRRILTNSNQEFTVIEFSDDRDADAYVEIDSQKVDQLSFERIKYLEEELEGTREQLKEVIENLESTTEELQASNEELMSSNEELQSTNEELQSVNEELHSVNAEFAQKNKELETSRNELNNLINSTQTATLFLDLNLNIRWFTNAIIEHFKLVLADVGRSIDDFSTNLNFEEKQLQDYASEVIETGTPVEVEIQNENNRYFIMRITPFLTTKGAVDGVVLTFIDVTKIKQYKDELKSNAMRADLATSATNLAIWEWLPFEDKFIANEKWHQVFGVTPGKNVRTRWTNQIHPDDLKNTNKSIIDHLSGKTDSYSIEARYIHPITNEVIWIEATGKTISRGNDGEPLQVMGVSRDITAQKRLQKELEKQNKLNKNLIESIPNGIFILDLEKNEFEFINHTFCKIVGIPYAQMKVNNIDHFIKHMNDEDQVKFIEHLETLRLEKHKLEVSFRFQTSNRGQIYCMSIDSPMEYDTKGNVVKVVGILADVTKEKEHLLELQKLRDEAIEANIQKSIFLSSMSHEIRTPMNGILGFADLLEHAENEEEKSQFLDIIKSNSNHLLHLIDDILELGKIEAKEVKLLNTNLDVESFLTQIKETYKNLKIKGASGNVEVKLKLPKNNVSTIYVDEFRLRQVITNLLNNALKFTKEGSVEFGYTTEKESITFFVKDTGIGIPTEKLTSIFDRFTQLNPADHSNKGTGLGLAISKGIIDAMGGGFSVESKVGVGSTFKFSIPIISEQGKQVDKKQAALEANYSIEKVNYIKDKHILIVEDNEFSQLALVKMLKAKGGICTVINNGEDAIETYKSNPNFDLILMDVNLPVINGFDATKQIRKSDKLVPIIMQSAFSFDNERLLAKESGCSDYITKPIYRQTLYQKLNYWLKPNS